MSNLIGLSGFKQSGKDTSCTLISELVAPEKVVRRAFADKLKISAARALGFDRPDEELIALMDSFKGDATFTINYSEPNIPQTAGAAGLGLPDRVHELSGREYLQWYGTEAHREVFADSFWIDQVLPTSTEIDSELGSQYSVGGVLEMVAEKFDNADWCIITDCRFPNEAGAVFDVYGEVWEIVRPGLESGDTHASEKPLPRELVTRQIVNDGTIEDLRHKLAAALNDYSVREDG